MDSLSVFYKLQFVLFRAILVFPHVIPNMKGKGKTRFHINNIDLTLVSFQNPGSHTTPSKPLVVFIIQSFK